MNWYISETDGIVVIVAAKDIDEAANLVLADGHSKLDNMALMTLPDTAKVVYRMTGYEDVYYDEVE